MIPTTIRTALFLLLLALAPAVALAEEPAARSPGDLTDAERMAMMKSANDYNSCVFKEAMSSVKQEDDIRHIADLAMGLCQPGLDTLKSTITGWGFEAYFAEGFARTIRDRAAHKLLPELAVKLSQ